MFRIDIQKAFLKITKKGGEGMIKKVKLLFLLVILTILFTAVFSENVAAVVEANECVNCHDNSYYFSVEPISRTAECLICHGGGKHAYWYDDNGYMFYSIKITDSGYFKSVESVYAPPEILHKAHSGHNDWAANSSCERCHQVASCTTCHVNVQHEGHGVSAFTPPSFKQANGISYSAISTSCALSPQCHQTMPTVKRTNVDGTQLCVNCHPRFGATAEDSTGHDPVAADIRHSTSLPGYLMLSSGIQQVDCSGCHVTSLVDEHANKDKDCSVCHNNSSNPAILTVVKAADNIEASRSCDKCHFNAGVIPVPEEHTLFHIATESNNLRIDGAPHDSCNTCHQRQEILPEIAALAGSSVKNYSCLDCHNGDGTSGSNPKAPVHRADYNGQQMNIMDVHASCAACHTPGTTYAAAIDTIVAENRSDSYSCTECHADLSAGHKATFEGVVYDDTTAFHLKCTDCHNATYKATITRLKDEVKLGGSYDCSACHTAAAVKGVSPYSPEHSAGSDEIVGFHPLSCNSCHGTANGQYLINLDPMRDNLPTPGYACTDCHNGTTANQPYHQAKADAAAAPEDVSSTYHQACSTCHGNLTVQPVLDGLRGTVNEPYMCSQCHNETLGMAPNHKAKMVAADTAEATITDYHLDADGETSCGMCHGSAKLPEGTIELLKAETAYLCDDCHKPGSVIAYSHTADFGTAAVDQNTTDYHAACQACHDSSAAQPVIKGLIGQNSYDCSQCHNGTVTYAALHQADMDTASGPVDTVAYHPGCLTCHDSQDTNVSGFIENNKGITAPYMCSDCHGDIQARHVSTSSLTGGMINCSWCHSGQLIDTHVNPGIDLPRAMDCATCHDPASPVRDQIALGLKRCEDCHNGTDAERSHPDSQYYPRHIADPFPAFMPEHNVNCSMCHTNNSLITLHSDIYVGCNTCHYTETYKPAVTSLSVDCSGCHTGDINPAMDMVDTHKQFHDADITTYPETAGCLECHARDATADGQNLLGVHKKDSASTVSCDTCHGAAARQSVKDAIAADNISCQACHGTGTGHEHNVAVNGYAAAPEVNCSACHADTADGTAELANVHRQAADSGLIPGYGCDTCHNTTFEGTVIPQDGNLDMLSNGIPIYCTDCHNGTLADALGAKYPAHDGNHSTTANGYGLYNWDSGVDCAQCHTTLDIYDNHIYMDSGADCNSCHTNTSAGVTGVIESNWSRTADKAGYNCSDCHNSLTYGHRYEHISTGDEPVTCSGCHNGTTVTGAFNAPAGTTATVSDSDIHPTCNKCHTTANSVVQAFIDAGTGQDNSVYACSACHDSITPKHNKMHEVTAFTADGATGCANCHQKDVTAQHSESFKAELNCDTCHGAGAAAVLPATPEVITANLSSNVNRTGYTCTDCHGSVSHQHRVPKNGYQSGQAGAGSAECSTCHATDASTGETELASLHENAGITGYGCSTCHNSTFEGSGKVISGDGNLNMNRNGQSIYCADCHDGTLTNSVDSGHQPEHLAKHSATNMDCTSCHGFSAGAGEAVDIKSAAVHSDGCVTCHGDNVRGDVKILVAAKTGQNNPVYDCEDCHSVIHLGWAELHKPEFPTDTNMNCTNCHNNYLPGEHTRYFDTGDSTGGTGETDSSVAYKVFRSSDGSAWSQAGTTTGTAFSVGGLTPVTQYWFKVQAYDAAGNVSGFSNTAAATTKTAPVTSPSETVGPDDARWGRNIDADRYYDRNIDSTVTSRLSDNSDGSYVEIRENGDSDWWVYVRVNKDARDYSSVKLKVRFRWDDSDWSGNMLFYPYKSDGKNINTGAVVDYKLSRPSTSYTWYEVDVTEAAHAMDGYGFIKFRIKPGRDGSAERAKLSEASFILESQGSTGSEDSVTTPSTTVPADNSGTDTVPPTDPTGLTAGSYNSAQIDLNWTASTDSSGPAPTPVEGEARTCALCHSSTARADVKTAVAGGNANCSACHTIHGDIGTMHTAPAYGFSGYTWNCGKCHTTVLTEEHANRGLDCSTCHDSAKAKVQGAIENTAADGSNRRCSNCHTGTADGAGAIHSDLNSAHLTGIFPTASDNDCLNCHSTQQQEFVSAKGSYHVVDMLTSKANSSYGTYVSPWTATSYVGCQGCHGASTPGGSLAYANILKRPYTYASSSRQSDMLCFMCHDRYTYGAGGDRSGRTGFSDGDNLHNIDDHNEDGLRCSWCHASMPHGTNKAHLIVTRGEPNSQGNVLTNFTHPASGQYRESSCGSNVNECDEHDEY